MRALAFWGVVCATAAGVGFGARAARADVAASEVRDAIDKSIRYLTAQQRPDGSWSEHVGQIGGVTALCTLALLEAGEEPDNPTIVKALGYLRRLEPQKTYTVSLQTMVFCRATPERDRLLIDRNVAWLRRVQLKSPLRTGAWAYPEGSGDNSNTQFAVLALHEAERIGVSVPPEVWRRALAHWKTCQNPDGSWGYQSQGSAGTGSMTCAGIACMVVASAKIQAIDARVEGGQIRCCQNNDLGNESIQRGLDWLSKHFSVNRNPGAPRADVWLLYYLYGLERVGRLTARRFIGQHDWYREGAEALIRLKGGPLSDRWKGFSVESDERIATSLALLFLSKGRWPILITKLKHGRGDWNAHRNDVNNLTRYVESRWKRDLVWQVSDLHAASVEDLGQSPVLYFAGANSPLPETHQEQDQLAAKLRGYVDRGGFLFAEGYCGGAAFDDGFRQLMTKVFPEPEYRLKVLPLDHPIWRAEAKVDPDYQPTLLGIEFGCRTSVVYCPPSTLEGTVRPSLSCLWELSRAGRADVTGTAYPPEVQKQVAAGLAVGLNVLAYATNRGELKTKEDLFLATDAPTPAKSPRGRLDVVALRHPGGCSTAPRALANLVEAAARELKIRINTQPREISITDPALFNHPVVFMHGRSSFRLTDAERKQLRTYLERGGVVFANAICANSAFADSFRHELKSILPENPLRPIPVKDPLFSTTYGGFDLSTVTRRDPQPRDKDRPMEAVLRKVPPELEGVKVGNHYGVIFSRFDLSCALEKHDSAECQGYVRDDAARIGLNVLLYALQQ